MKKIHIIILILIISTSLFGQISHGGRALSFTNKVRFKSVAVFNTPEFDYNKMIEEDLAANKNASNRYGKVHKVNLNPQNNGTWQTLSNENKIWRLAIKSKEAYSLSLIFNNYELKNNAKIFIYSPDRKSVIGAFTGQNNKSNHWFATIPIKGDEVIIELNTFGNEDYGSLNISGIVHDYKGIMGLKTGYGAADYCNVNINCKQGFDWQIEKRAVVTIYASGLYCTGTLINNTAKNAEPYLLTASHCIAEQSDAQSGVYSFNYESVACKSTQNPIKQSIAGADVVATGGKKLDFTLLRLSETPPNNYKVYYAGWNRDVPFSNTPFVCIHHPQGDIKKISIANSPIVIADYGDGFEYNSHYKVNTWDIGTTEGGSSGSALFDNHHLIIGDLSGGDAKCSNNHDDYYTRFDVCWDYFLKPRRQLKSWLDPINIGTKKLKGMFPYIAVNGLDAAMYNSSYFNTEHCFTNTMTARFILKNNGNKIINGITFNIKVDNKVIDTKIWKGELTNSEEKEVEFIINNISIGRHIVQAEITSVNDKQDLVSDNNNAWRTIVVKKPIEEIKIEGNKNICDESGVETYAVKKTDAKIEKYNWKVEGGKIIGSENSQNVKVKWDRWGKKNVSVGVSNHCSSKDTNLIISVVEQHLVFNCKFETNDGKTSCYIVNCNGDTVASACDLPNMGNYSTNICLPAGCYRMIIRKEDAKIAYYQLYRKNDKQIIAENNNIENDINEEFYLKPVEKANINVYPNPTKSVITIEAFFKELYSNSEIGIFNTLGKVMMPYTPFTKSFTIDVSRWNTGIYVVKLKTEYGELAKIFMKD